MSNTPKQVSNQKIWKNCSKFDAGLQLQSPPNYQAAHLEHKNETKCAKTDEQPQNIQPRADKQPRSKIK